MPGRFPWSRVLWSRGDALPPKRCSLCLVPLDPDDVPLRVWRPSTGAAIALCERCAFRALFDMTDQADRQVRASDDDG